METGAGVVAQELEEVMKKGDKDDDLMKMGDKLMKMMKVGEEELLKKGEEEEATTKGDEEEEDEEEEWEERELAVDVKLIRDCLTPGVEGEVPLPPYVKAYSELNKFVKLMGPLFTFVTYDVKNKLMLLRKEMAGKNGHHYVDVRTMIKFETENGIVQRTSPHSGTYVFLKLQRSLEFVRGFMEELLEEEEEPPLSQVSSELYLSTLGRFHPSILKRAFSGVLLLLPDRATIRNKMTKGKEEAEETLRRLLSEAIKSVTETHEASQKLYRDHDLLSL